MNKQKVFGFDFIRAVSIMAIVIYHFGATMIRYKIGSPLSTRWEYPNGDLSTIGVSLFFILSGAVLMFNYSEDLPLKKYFSKRFLSIYPMFWIAYTLAFLFQFYVNKTIPHLPNINFLLTVVGMDGYLNYKFPTYYILGEWFLGCIIMLYVIFPLLRKFVVKTPLIFPLVFLVLYVIFIETYMFEMPVTTHFISRIPEMLFGMYFVRFAKHLKWWHVTIAGSVFLLLLTIRVNIDYVYKLVITGAAVFTVLHYIGEKITIAILKDAVNFISRYSFAIFLTHHVIIVRVVRGFSEMELTNVETLSLFLISLLLILLISLLLFKISTKIVISLNRYFSKS